jgi:hypothetical protein
MGEIHTELLRYSEDFAQDPAPRRQTSCRVI